MSGGREIGLAVSGDFLYERKDLLLSRDWRGFERLMVTALYFRADDTISKCFHCSSRSSHSLPLPLPLP